MLLFTLPLTPAFTAHAMGASTRPSRLASLKMALSTAPGLKDRIEHEVPAVQDFSKAKKVGVIGAGVAGLQAANELRKAGLEVKVFEKSAGLAGVWRENYDGFALQVPRELYEFPGYPYPDAKMREISGKGFSKFPQGAEVAEYIRMFVDDMELQQLISFQTSVTRLEPIAGGDGWAMHHGKQGKAEVVEQFDFVVVATGMYSSSNAHFPTTEGMDRFQGKVMHSCQFTDASVCQGKSVVVVGGGKSSIDCVHAAAKKGAKAASVVFRNAHWPVPRKLLNLVPFKWGTYSRFGHFMLPTHYNTPPLWKYVHDVFSPIKWLWWRIVETMFRVQFGLEGDLLPRSRIELDLFGGGQIHDYNFRDMLKRKELQAIKGSISSFDEHGVTLEDGTRLDADIVVYGTGFGKSYEYFDQMQNRLNIDSDGLFLYRNILPTGLPNVAFVGAEVSTFNNILTQGLQAVWLKRLLCGEFSLPPRVEMERAIETEQAWKRTWMPFSSARAALFQLHMPKYHDQLLMDMGEPHLRKGRNKLAEIFQPYCAADYKDLFA